MAAGGFPLSRFIRYRRLADLPGRLLFFLPSPRFAASGWRPHT
jgi:hypothetical protein